MYNLCFSIPSTSFVNVLGVQTKYPDPGDPPLWTHRILVSLLGAYREWSGVMHKELIGCYYIGSS